MFEPKNNKYTRWYFALVKKRQDQPLSRAEGYCESHHIHPKKLGGSNRKINLVLFTPREHFVAHLLLTKMLDGDPKRKMNFAFYSMRRGTKAMERYTPNSHLYSIFTKNIRREATDEARAKMSAFQLSRPPRTDEQLKNLSEGIKSSYTPELRLFRSTSQMNKVFTNDHQQNLKKSAQARWASDESKKDRDHLAKLASERRGAASGRSKTWSIQSPTGKLYLTSSCADFCAEHGISYFGLRNKAVTNDTTPVSRGISKGWSVLSCTEKD